MCSICIMATKSNGLFRTLLYWSWRLGDFCRRIGWLRAGMLALSILSLPCAFIREVESTFWSVLIVHTAPGFAFLMIWSIPFDVVLAKVFMADKSEAEQADYRLAIKADWVVWAAMVLAWGWFLASVLEQRLS